MKQSIQPANSWAIMSLAGTGLLVTFVALFTILSSGSGPVPTLIGLAICLPLTAVLLWLAVAQGNSFIETDAKGVQLKVPLYGRHVAWSQIDVDNIDVLQLTRDKPLSLRWRTNGVGVPGYQLGWFRTRNKSKVLAAVTHPNVIVVPTLEGYSIMASVANPRSLADALRKTRQSNSR